MENQNDVLVRVDRTGRLDFVSPSFCDMLGQPEPAILGTRFLKVVHKEDRRRIVEATSALARPPHTFQVQTRAMTRKGVRWISWAGRAVHGDDSGELTEIVGIGRDVTDVVLAGERIANSLAEKEFLLQEIHHRVKNNLQIICSLLDMASRRLHSPEDKELFKDVHSKIEGMSLIHSQLYQSERFDSIDMGDYAAALFRQLANMYGTGNLTAQMDTRPVLLPINLAIPCGLVLNEMLTNIFKHAFDANGGTVGVYLRKEDDMVRLSVADDGRGLPDGLGAPGRTLHGHQAHAQHRPVPTRRPTQRQHRRRHRLRHRLPLRPIRHTPHPRSRPWMIPIATCASFMSSTACASACRTIPRPAAPPCSTP